MRRPFGGRAALLLLGFSILCGLSLAAEKRAGELPRLQVETSVWMLANLFPEPPDFYQLCLGYQVNEKTVLFLNGITWKYWAPLGIPMYDPSFDSPDEEYPGYVRGFGLGLGYQRRLWKGLFAALYAIPFLQTFSASDDRRIQTGFQLYLQAQLGYQVDVFQGRAFIKPAVYLNYWPINTNLPDAFLDKEKNWPNFQPFEPHLNIGFRLD